MSIERTQELDGTEGTPGKFESSWAWKIGAASGLVATVAMGVAISTMNLAVLREAIAGLYGFEGVLVAGWAAHLFHGTLFGIIFGGFMTDPGIHGVSRWAWKTVVAGVVFGIVLAIVGAGIIMPIWLGTVGFPASPEMPYVTVGTLVWHVVYGFVLGALFWYLDDVDFA